MIKEQNINIEIEYGKGDLKEILTELIRDKFIDYITMLKKTGDD